MKQVEEILQAGDLDALVGLAEDLQLEVKAEEYDLAAASGRFELAKDVSAFANAEGGHLLIGARTVRSRDRDEDIVDRLTLLPRARFEPSRYEGVLREHVHPQIKGLGIAFLAQQGGDVGLGVIMVPVQHPDSRPFLITKVVEDGEYLKLIVAGYAERQGGRNEPLSPKVLQRRLMKGSDTIAQRLGRIEEKLDQLVEPHEEERVEHVVDRDLLDARVREISQE